MRIAIKETAVYKFEELSEEGKDKAIERLWDINVEYDWWDFVYSDAKEVGLKIEEFDLDRGQYVRGHFILSAAEVAANIIRDHGETCSTYKTARAFLDAIDNNPMPSEDEDERFGDWENEMIEIEDGFLKELLDDYLIMLRDEYKYQTSREAIVETIEANEYEFTVDGKIYH